MEERIREYLETITAYPDLVDWISLDLSELNLTEIPELPSIITAINISYNNLQSLPEIPKHIVRVNASNNNIRHPVIPNHIVNINLSNNNISEDFLIPDSLLAIYINNNNLKKVPALHNKFLAISVDNNELTEFPELPESIQQCSFKNNKINSVKISNRFYDIINLANNNIEVINIEDSTIGEINLDNNPLQKVISKNSTVRLSAKNTPYFNKEVKDDTINFKTFTHNSIEYKYYTIPKGTLLFRRTRNPQKISESLVGFKKNNNYLYPPNHRVYFSMYPVYTNVAGYGNIQTVWELKDDINLVVSDNPNYTSGIMNSCNTEDTYEDADYRVCIEEDIFLKYKIRGVFIHSGKNSLVSILPNGKQFFIPSIISPNISFYSRKIYKNKDIITPVKDYNLKWLVNHLNEFVVEPMIIMDTNETLDKLFSKNGYKHIDGITYKIVQKDYGFVFE